MACTLFLAGNSSLPGGFRDLQRAQCVPLFSLFLFLFFVVVLRLTSTTGWGSLGNKSLEMGACGLKGKGTDNGSESCCVQGDLGKGPW